MLVKVTEMGWRGGEVVRMAVGCWESDITYRDSPLQTIISCITYDDGRMKVIISF